MSESKTTQALYLLSILPACISTPWTIEQVLWSLHIIVEAFYTQTRINFKDISHFILAVISAVSFQLHISS